MHLAQQSGSTTDRRCPHPPSRRARAVRAVALLAASSLLIDVLLPVPAQAVPAHRSVAEAGDHDRPVAISSVTVPALVSGNRTEVRVRASGEVAAVSGLLHSGGLRFRREGQDWVSTLTRSGRQLRPGLNQVLVLVRGRDGSTADRTVSTYLTGSRADLGLALSNRSAAGAAAIGIHLHRAANLLDVTVNGHPLRTPAAANGGWQSIGLSAGDGLRPGLNRILATAVTSDGRWQRASTVLRLGPGPVADAGIDRTGRVGVPVNLDGSGSRAGAGSPSYRWQLQRAPRGSTAGLLTLTTARPALTPDRPGIYVLRLEVTDRLGRRAADTVNVTVTGYTAPVGARVLTQASSGSTLQISQDGTIRASIAATAGGSSMLALWDRKSLEPIGSYTATAEPGQVQAEVAAFQQAGSGPGGEGLLAVLSVAGGNGTRVGPLLTALGVKPDATMSGGGAFSVVVATGTGTAANQVWRSSKLASAPPTGTAAGNLTGYFQLTNGGVGPYTFVPALHLAYDTASAASASSNTMSLGCPGPSCATPASSPLATCAAAVHPGGFQVVVASAHSLAVQANRTFTTNDGCTGPTDAAADAAAVQAMQTWLTGSYPAGQDGTPDRIVAVQSIGTPRNVEVAAQSGDWAAVTTAWRALAVVLAGYGATAAEFAAIGQRSVQGYALLGSTAVGLPGSDSAFGPEVSAGNATGTAAVLAGLLTPNHRNDLAPVVNSSGGAIDNRLGLALYSAPQTWPYSSTAGEQAVLAYVTNILGPSLPDAVYATSGAECYNPAAPSFRDAYCNTLIDWNGVSGELASQAKLAPPAGTGLNPSDWSQVLSELATETGRLQYASDIITFLQTPFQQAAQGVNLTKVITDVTKTLTPTQASTSGAVTWLSIVGEFFGFLWAGLPEPYNNIAGLFSEGFALGATLLSTADGGPAMTAPVRSTADDLSTALVNRYEAASQNLAYLRDILVTDPGKLQAAKEIGLTLAGTPEAINTEIDGLRTAATGWLITQLLGALFTPDKLMVADSNDKPVRAFTGDASTFACARALAFGSQVYQPYPGVSSVQQYTALTASGPVRYVLATPGRIIDQGGQALVLTVPPAAVLNQLFGRALPGDNSNAGVDPMHFFERDLDLSTATTQACQDELHLYSAITAVAPTAGTRQVFFHGDFGLQGVTYSATGGDWLGSPLMPGPVDPGSALAATSPAEGSTNVFFISKGKLVNDYRASGQEWQGPGGLPGSPDQQTPLAATSTGPGDMHVFFLQRGQLTYDAWSTATGWTGPYQLPYQPDGQSGLAALAPNGQLHVFFALHGIMQNVWYSGGQWQGPGPMPGNPDRGYRSMAAFSAGPGDAHVFFLTKGIGQNDWNGNGWDGPGPINARAASTGIAATAGPGSLPWQFLFTRGGVLYVNSYSPTLGWTGTPVAVTGSGV